jgi:hypothetical protein
LRLHLAELAFQLRSVGRSRPWADYFFPWLFNRHMASSGLWGLHFYRELLGGSAVGRLAWVVGSSLVGGALSVLLVAAVLRGALGRGRCKEGSILAACVAAFWGGAGALFLLGHHWVAGKAFAMGYPFATFTALWSAVSVSRRLAWRAGTSAFVAIWTVLQMGTFAFRARGVLPGAPRLREYVNFKTEGVSSILDVLPAARTGLLAADFTGEGELLERAWLLVLSERSDLLPLQAQPLGRRKGWKESCVVPRRLLLARTRDYMSLFGLGCVLARNDRLTLHAVTAEDLDTALLASDVGGPTGRSVFVLDNVEQAGRSLWLAGDRSGLRFLASGTRSLALRLRYLAHYTGRLSVAANGSPLMQSEVWQGRAGEAWLCFTPRPGTNWLTFEHPTDSPAASPGAPDASRRLSIQELALMPVTLHGLAHILCRTR